jgi:hypothetical protein
MSKAMSYDPAVSPPAGTPELPATPRVDEVIHRECTRNRLDAAQAIVFTFVLLLTALGVVLL